MTERSPAQETFVLRISYKKDKSMMIQKVDNIMRVNALPILEKACICWSDLIIPFNNEKEYDQIQDYDKKR